MTIFFINYVVFPEPHRAKSALATIIFWFSLSTIYSTETARFFRSNNSTGEGIIAREPSLEASRLGQHTLVTFFRVALTEIEFQEDFFDFFWRKFETAPIVIVVN